MKYEIRPGKTAPCELVGVAQTKFGSKPAINFICEGTHTYCMSIKNRLESAQ